MIMISSIIVFTGTTALTKGHNYIGIVHVENSLHASTIRKSLRCSAETTVVEDNEAIIEEE